MDFKRLIVIAALLLAVTGCSDNSSNPTNPILLDSPSDRDTEQVLSPPHNGGNFLIEVTVTPE